MSLLLAGGAAPPAAPSIIGGWFAEVEDDFEDFEQQAVFWVADAVVVVAFVDSFRPDVDDDEDELPPDQTVQWIDFIQTIFRVPDEEVNEEDDLGDFSAFIPDSPVVTAQFVDSFRSEVEDEEEELADYSFWPLQDDLIQVSFDLNDDLEDEIEQSSFFIPDTPVVILGFVDSFHAAEDDDFYENEGGNDFEAISFPIEPDPTPPTPGVVYQTNMRGMGAMHEIDTKQVKMYRSMKMH